MTEPVLLSGARVLIRPGSPEDAVDLHRIRSEPSVMQWWNAPDPVEEIAAGLRGEREEVRFVIEVDGEVAGEIQYAEENDPDYRYASIDLYVGTAFQSRGLGTEAVAVLAAYLIDVRGHRRLTIDPTASNERAVRSYQKVGFRPVGVMREYERAMDGSYRDGLLMDLLAHELVRVPQRGDTEL